MRKPLYSVLILALTSTWFGWTVLVDFFIVPTVFTEIDDFFKAGALGISVFSKLNNLELIAASFIMGLAVMNFDLKRSSILSLATAILLGITSLFMFSFLTPKIIYLTELWKTADMMGLVGLSGIADLQQEHQFYHRIYIGVDTLKMLLLIYLGGSEILRLNKNL
jgi:hypothetical protein